MDFTNRIRTFKLTSDNYIQRGTIKSDYASLH